MASPESAPVAPIKGMETLCDGHDAAAIYIMLNEIYQIFTDDSDNPSLFVRGDHPLRWSVEIERFAIPEDEMPAPTPTKKIGKLTTKLLLRRGVASPSAHYRYCLLISQADTNIPARLTVGPSLTRRGSYRIAGEPSIFPTIGCAADEISEKLFKFLDDRPQVVMLDLIDQEIT